MKTKFSIHQMAVSERTVRLMFRPAEITLNRVPSGELPDLYLKVWEGEQDVSGLEDIFRMFNTDDKDSLHFTGRSLSVSDIVLIQESEAITPGAYYVDDFGFKPVEFKPKTIDVVYVEPGLPARIVGVQQTLKGYQTAVGGGLIELFYAGIDEEDGVVIVCNEESKIAGMELNRAIFDQGELIDIIAGPFFICDARSEQFESLSPELLEKYRSRYETPHNFTTGKKK